jgi:hypothetical protein
LLAAKILYEWSALISKWVEVKIRGALSNIILFFVLPVLIVVLQYYANVMILSGNRYLSPTEVLFYEDILYVIGGLLFLMGMRNYNLRKAAEVVAIAKAFPSGDEYVGPAGFFRRYIWQAKGSTRLGLILIFAGLLMIITYFLTL